MSMSAVAYTSRRVNLRWLATLVAALGMFVAGAICEVGRPGAVDEGPAAGLAEGPSRVEGCMTASWVSSVLVILKGFVCNCLGGV